MTRFGTGCEGHAKPTDTQQRNTCDHCPSWQHALPTGRRAPFSGPGSPDHRRMDRARDQHQGQLPGSGACGLLLCPPGGRGYFHPAANPDLEVYLTLGPGVPTLPCRKESNYYTHRPVSSQQEKSTQGFFRLSWPTSHCSHHCPFQVGTEAPGEARPWGPVRNRC